MSRWVVADVISVQKHSILKSILVNHMAFYVVLDVGKTHVLCAELEQNFSNDYTLVYLPASVNDHIQAYKRGKTNYYFYFRFDEKGFLRSGGNSLQVEEKIDPANCSTKIFSTPATLPDVYCALCDRANTGCVLTGPLSIISEDGSDEQIWAHAYCFALSAKLADETVANFLKRVRQASCSHCKRRNASLNCNNKRCHQKFHLRCVAKAGAEYVHTPGEFYCEKHLRAYSQEHQRDILRFPEGTAEYWRCSNWDSISARDFQKLCNFAPLYQPNQVHWVTGGFYNFVQVVEIFAGNWAFDNDIPNKRQYRVVAREDIANGCVFGEYVGKAYYANDPKSDGSFYRADLLLPDAVAKEVPPIVIDSAEFGNEMRFINSVAPWTPKNIEKNVVFVTYWVAGLPRIMLEAIKSITKGEEIILEYGKDYFEDQ